MRPRWSCWSWWKNKPVDGLTCGRVGLSTWTVARYKAIVEYDGTDYAGFQRQAAGHGPTVQGDLEAALAAINGGQAVAVLGAGRTDSGVHAAGQVVAFDLNWGHGPAALARALNANLARAIAVLSAEVCAPDFHPRFRARGRRYRYSLLNAPTRSPLRERYVWQVWPALNVEAMGQASQSLLGRKDFAAFGTAPEAGGHTVREIRQARWETLENGALLNFYIEADAFLYRMVRSIVGTLKQVGEGSLTAGEFGAIVASAERSRSAAAAPPGGLCLVEVLY
jgi:tRNA pseudouridine38-40 synthase